MMRVIMARYHDVSRITFMMMMTQQVSVSLCIYFFLTHGYLVYRALCLDLDIHRHKEGEEEENPTGESQEFTGGELSIWPDLGGNIITLSTTKTMTDLREGVRLFEREDGGYGADNHHEDGEQEHGVQHPVLAGDARHPPVANLKQENQGIMFLV